MSADRPHVEHIQAAEVEPAPLPAGPLKGIACRILSEDAGTGSFTGLLEAANGFSTSLRGFARPLETLVLNGRIAVDEAELGPGGYAYIEPTRGERTFAAARGTRLLLMLEPQSADLAAGEARLLDTTRMPWADRTISTVPPGLTVKVLRHDPENGERTWIGALVPGWTEPRIERHPTVEEGFLLRGDCLLGERGEMSPGCYFWRPPNVAHGPMTTRGGQVMFFRTKGGALEVTYEEMPGGREMLEAYMAREPYFAGR